VDHSERASGGVIGGSRSRVVNPGAVGAPVGGDRDQQARIGVEWECNWSAGRQWCKSLTDNPPEGSPTMAEGLNQLHCSRPTHARRCGSV
jgi:hypothetical protein